MIVTRERFIFYILEDSDYVYCKDINYVNEKFEFKYKDQECRLYRPYLKKIACCSMRNEKKNFPVPITAQSVEYWIV